MIMAPILVESPILSESGKDCPAASAIVVPLCCGMSKTHTKSAGPPPTDPVMLTVEENVNVTFNRHGGFKNFYVAGNLFLEILNQQDGLIQVQIETGDNKAIFYDTDPFINGKLFSKENILGFKDPSRPFSTGPYCLMKWGMQSYEKSSLPLTINCWPYVSGNESYVNIKYETPAQIDLRNVVISVPLPALREAPSVQQIDGEWRYDSGSSVFEWSIVLIDDSNRSGSLEFVVPEAHPSVFFPITVRFTASRTYSELQVVKILPLSGGPPPRFSQRTLLTTKNYQVL